MSLSKLDKTRQLRTGDELGALVAAIYASPPGTQETNWLEWKSALDLSKEEGRFAVAKTILGFANRSVADAMLACEGVAYMVVGAEPSGAQGMPVSDHATLSQGINPYVGAARWSAHYVDFADVKVLVIVVEPPRAGDPIHPLQKQFTPAVPASVPASGKKKAGHYQGAIFCRRQAQTEPAGPQQIAMLQDRLLDGQRLPDLQLKFGAVSDPLIRLDGSGMGEWLRRHEKYVRDNSGAPPPPPPPAPREPQTTIERLVGASSAGRGVGAWFAYPPKGAEEFERRVKSYLAAMEERLPRQIVKDIVLCDDLNKAHFAVTNVTDEPIVGVQVTLAIPRSDLHVYTSAPSAEPLPPLPKWPDEYAELFSATGLVPPPIDYASLMSSGPVVRESEGAYEVTWDVGDLRPGGESDPLEITVVASPNAPDEVEVTMTAGAMNRRGRVTEKTTLVISRKALALEDFYLAEADE